MRKVQRRGSKSAYPVNLLSEAVSDGRKRSLHHGTSVIVEAGANETFTHLVLLAHMNGLAIMSRPVSSAGHIQVIMNRIPNNAALCLALKHIRDGDSKMRNTVGKVCRAIKRIHDPQMFGGTLPGIFFFAENRMVRKSCVNHFHHSPLRSHIRVSDKIGHTFVTDSESLSKIT